MLDLSDVFILVIVGYVFVGEVSFKGFLNGLFLWEEEVVFIDFFLDVIFKGFVDVGFLSCLKRVFEFYWERFKGKFVGGGVEAKNVEQEVELNDDWGEWEGVEEESEDGEYLEVYLKLEIRDWL